MNNLRFTIERTCGSWWRHWLRCSVTSRDVTGSIPHWVFDLIASISNRNEYQGYLLGGKGNLCVRLTTLSTCADWEPRNSRALRACPVLNWDSFIFLLYNNFTQQSVRLVITSLQTCTYITIKTWHENKINATIYTMLA